jgi:hypothetical protein
MAQVLADRVSDTSTTVGTGDFTVSGTAPSGYRTFSSVLSVSDTFYYAIQHQTANEFEVGLATYSGTNQFTRTTVLSSSNANAAVSFSAGTKGVILTLAAAGLSDFVTLTGTQTLSGKTLTEPAIDGTIVEEVFTITDGASVDIDPSNGSIQLWTLGANRTPVLPTSWTAGQGITLQIDDGSAYAITWTTMGVVWAGGDPPTLATTGYTVVELWKVGTTIYGALVGDVA